MASDAPPPANKLEGNLIANLSEVSSNTFDYVVVGGGTSGLALASRLAEDPNITIAVLEAGGETHTYDTIIIPAQYGREHGNPELVYSDKTTEQTSLGRSLAWDRGRGLGGSSAVNFMVFQKPPAFDIDNWEKLGSPGWNWNQYHEAVKRAETFHPPPKEDAEKFGFEYDIKSHGVNGPIHTGYAKIKTAGEVRIKEAFKNMGVRIVSDPAGGDITGLASFPNSIDPRTNTRSYAATGYLLQKPERPNLKILTKARARKIVFRDGTVDPTGLVEADGVEFEYDGMAHIVHAKREVVLAAGAVQSSSLLERSGIGNREILERLGIRINVHNPAVGENVQEHMIAPIIWELNTEKYPFETLDMMADPEYAREQVKLYPEGRGLLLTQMNHIGWLPLSQISGPSRAAELIAAEEARISADLGKLEGARPGLREQYELQIQNLKDDKLADAEFIVAPFFFPSPGGTPQPGKSYVTIICGLNHPFSRGHIHIKSSDPNAAAEMDPNVFDHPFDLELLVEMFKFSRKLASTQPFKDMIVDEAFPGPATVTDADIKECIKKGVVSTWHTAGTCAMRPREKGGVVDATLKVYGTKNLRVGDISIIPLHINAHTQTTAYAIAEQLADLIKNEPIS